MSRHINITLNVQSLNTTIKRWRFFRLSENTRSYYMLPTRTYIKYKDKILRLKGWKKTYHAYMKGNLERYNKIKVNFREERPLPEIK